MDIIKITKEKNKNYIDFIGEKTQFNYYINTIMSFKNRVYDFEVNKWYVLDNDLDDLKIKFNMIKPKPKVIDKSLDKIGSNLKLKPYYYQKEAINYCINNDSCLLRLPCGSGKTIIGIGSFLERKSKTKKLKGLIVVKASLKRQWLTEVSKFSDLTATIINTPSAAGKKKFEEQFADYDLYIANYETLNNKEVKKKLHKMKIDFIFADEIQYIKSHSAKRSKSLYEFNYVKYKIGATATPITKDPEDVFGIFNFINQEIFTSHSNFARSYIQYASYGRPIGFKNTNMLNKKITPYMFSKEKEEISEQLPKLAVYQRYCSMTKEMTAMNNKIFNDLDEAKKEQKNLISSESKEDKERVQKLDAIILGLQTFAQELVDDPRLLSSSDSEMSKSYAIEDNTSPKLELLLELVEEIIESGEKVCIFTKFKRMQEFLIKELEKTFDTKVAFVNGSMNTDRRHEEIYTKFRDNDDYKILIGTDSMSEGVNLSHCKYLIEFELANSYAIQTQRHGRLERSDNKNKNVIVYQLICEDSWDTIAQKIIEKKEGYDFDIIKS